MPKEVSFHCFEQAISNLNNMIKKNTQEQIQANLQMLADASTNVTDKPAEYNLLIINTPKGKMKIKTQLTAQEWIAEQELKLKNKPKKKRK